MVLVDALYTWVDLMEVATITRAAKVRQTGLLETKLMSMLTRNCVYSLLNYNVICERTLQVSQPVGIK